ncbi:hypothetical protein BpHYR1_000751 [Brachionus plicatilis]|uniref:Uncharacterized protein n=1 Tax=Brachionus plicatilis TaxID=10195 RepID=A0A3M7S3E2_BRAPC|nr:hypothetical protein BpHYR1_000751 [Brachionus plicatilis]
MSVVRVFVELVGGQQSVFGAGIACWNNNAYQRTSIRSAASHQRAQFSLLVAALFFQVFGHLVNERIEDYDDAQRAPKIGKHESYGKKFVGAPGDIAVFWIEFGLGGIGPAKNRVKQTV